MTGGAGGIDNTANLQGTEQHITTTGDVVLTGHAGGLRLGGPTGGATDLELNVGGSLFLTSGDNPNATTTIGSSGVTPPTLPPANNITISAGEDVIVAARGAVARIGRSGPGTISVTAGGRIELNGTSTATPAAIRGTGHVSLAAGTTISENQFGLIEASALSTNSGGDTTLTGANQVASFNATSGGDVTLNNSGVLDVTGMNAFSDATITNLGDLTVSGPWTAGGTSAITVGSSIFLKSHMQSHDVQLVSTTGDIVQDAGASIDAVSLTTSSFGDTELAGTNAVETVVSDSGGDLSLHTVSALLRLSGVHLPGVLTVDNTGAIAVTGEVSAFSHELRATGDITIGGADAPGATLLHAPGFITISTPASIWVRGSDTSAGAGSAVLAGGALSLNASNVTLLGGGAALTPVLARGDVVNMAVGKLNVTGGTGSLSPAWLSSGTDINLRVGDAVRLQTGSGLLSWARVQTETREGEIHITFPSPSVGGYFVDGIEDGVKHGQTGFYTLLKPVKVGDTLILTYEGE